MKKKKIEIARKGLVWALVCGMTASTFVGCKDYDDDINGLRTEIDGIKTGSIATMQKQLEGLLAAEQSLKGADEAVKASIAELEKTLKVHKEANDQLAALMGGKVDQVAYEGVVTALQEKDAAFAQQVADLLENKADNAAIQAVLTELAGKITALEGSAVTMAQVASEIAESERKLSSQIADLKSGAIADLKDATESNLELINEIKTQLGVFNGTVSGLIDAKIDLALTQTMKNNIAKIAGIEASVNEILGDYLKKTVFDEAKNALYAKVKVDSLALQGQINNITSLDNAQSLASKLAALNAKMYGDDTNPEDKGVAGIAADALALAKANQTAISTLISNALGESGAITKAISTAITTEMNKYLADGKTLSERLDNIFDRLSSLEGRVQSIAYVPEYNDGKVPHYFAGTNAGDLTLKFRVSPAKVAKDIKKEHISFFTKTLMTRSEGMTVNTVVADSKEEGVIIVQVTPGSGLVYSNEITQNAVALKLNNADANANLTTGYFIVEKVALQNTDFKFVGTTNYSYTNNESHSLTETMKAQIKGRPVAELGFADGFVITKIGTYEVNDENKDDIDTYLETAGFALDMTAMTIQVKENKPGSIGKSLKLTLENEATGYVQELDFKVDAVGATKDYDYKDIITSLDDASAAKTFVWENQVSNSAQVYTLKSDALAGMIEGKTVAEIITALQAATATYSVMGDTEYEEATVADAKLSVADGKVSVTLPANAAWKTYAMQTKFALANYGDIVITATLNLSYPTADFLNKQAALWSDNGYLLQYTPVSGTELTIAKELTGAFKAVTGVVYSFEILATIDDDNDPKTPQVVPAGVTIADGKTITFSENVDLSKLQIKATAKVENNATGKEATFGIDMAYPVKTAFEPFVKDNKPVALTYGAALIKAGTAYDWATDLQLKDMFNNDLMADGAFNASAFITTYGLTGLSFTYVGNDGGLSADMFEVDATTGALTFTSTSLAKDVNVTVKVAAINKYGASQSTYGIKLEKTN